MKYQIILIVLLSFLTNLAIANPVVEAAASMHTQSNKFLDAFRTQIQELEDKKSKINTLVAQLSGSTNSCDKEFYFPMSKYNTALGDAINASERAQSEFRSVSVMLAGGLLPGLTVTNDPSIVQSAAQKATEAQQRYSSDMTTFNEQSENMQQALRTYKQCK